MPPFKVLLQYVLPHHFLSRIMHRLTRSRYLPFRHSLIAGLVKLYRIDIQEAQEPDFDNRQAYPNLNSCFTRALKPQARPLAAEAGAVCSPADGTLSQIGAIDEERLVQAKGHDYNLFNLLGGSRARSELFRNGQFATIYLSPRDYHRVHMPLAGRLVEMVHVPGRLFSVSPSNIAAIPNLFARNERVISLFETCAGPMAVVMVGAIFVGSIETVWAGEVTPPHGRLIQTSQYRDQQPPIELAQGEELGRFNMGSTVIILFAAETLRWRAELEAGAPLRMGLSLGQLVNSELPSQQSVP